MLQHTQPYSPTSKKRDRKGSGGLSSIIVSLLRLFICTLVIIAALTSQGAASDREDSREERAAQVIYNALYRTRDAGEPSQAAVEGYRRSKPVGSQVGTGLQGICNPTDEDGWGMYVKYDVIFPSAEGIDQIRSDYGQFFEFERTDGRTGAEIHRSGRYVHVLYFADDVVLRMQWGTARTDEGPDDELGPVDIQDSHFA